MVIAFIIWSLGAAVFVMIGFGSLKAKEEVGFFTFAKPPKTKDCPAYNRAVAVLWFSFAFLLEMLGVPLLFVQQDSPVAILIILGTVILVIGIMIAYTRIEKKYRA